MGSILVTSVPVYGLPMGGAALKRYRALVLSTPGLLGYWQMQEQSGTVATDETGLHNGTYTGGFTLGQPGPFGQSPYGVSFDGTSGYIGTTASLINVSGASYEIFVKTAATGRMRLYYNRGGAMGLSLSFGPTATQGVNGDLNLWFDADSTDIGVKNTDRIWSDGLWHHIVGTYDGNGAYSGFAIYVDGRTITTVAGGNTGSIPTTWTGGTALKIGTDGSSFFNGSLAQASFYNVALTANQVALRYRASRD